MYNTNLFKERSKSPETWLMKELSTIRTGRANPGLLDGVKVSVYGQDMPINQVASIVNEDARTIRIAPWDTEQIKPIEKALTSASLGVSVSVDEKGVRVSFPSLTAESRGHLVKLARGKLEEARISLRKQRDDEVSAIEKAEKAGGIGEDDRFRLKAEVQKIVDETNKKLEEIFSKKEKEITS